MLSMSADISPKDVVLFLNRGGGVTSLQIILMVISCSWLTAYFRGSLELGQGLPG